MGNGMSFNGEVLRALNERFPHDRVKRHAALRASQRKLLLASSEPQTGIFWWVPTKRGWQITAFFDSQFGDPDHRKIWKAWANTILGRDDAHAAAFVAGARCGLPRGRVRKIAPRKHGVGPTAPLWLILQGDDAPIRNTEKKIAAHFRLPEGEYRLVFDNHECMLRKDVAIVERYLGRDLGLLKKAVGYN